MNRNRLNLLFSLKTAHALSLSALICFGSFYVSAQEPKPTATPPAAQEQVLNDDEIIKVDSRLVVVPVSVTDQNGEAVKNMTATDFQLDEEGRRQQIAEISTADQVPLEIAVLIDVSSSVNKIFEIEKDAAARFLQNVMKPDDRATLFLIGEKPMNVQTRATAEEMAVKVRSIQSANVTTATAFYDSVTAAGDFLKKNAPARTRRVILVLSDGEDNFSQATRKSESVAASGINVNTVTQKELNSRASRTTRAHLAAQNQVLRDLQENDTVFYSINPSGPSVRLNISSQRAQNGLQKFADETGGTAFLPQILSTVIAKQPLQSQENERLNRESLDRIFRQIAAELRAQYLLQYYSDSTFEPGKYVRLKVELPTKTALRVRARQGYFADAARQN